MKNTFSNDLNEKMGFFFPFQFDISVSFIVHIGTILPWQLSTQHI